MSCNIDLQSSAAFLLNSIGSQRSLLSICTPSLPAGKLKSSLISANVDVRAFESKSAMRTSPLPDCSRFKRLALSCALRCWPVASVL